MKEMPAAVVFAPLFKVAQLRWRKVIVRHCATYATYL
jgi:hypothetical protein